MDDMLIKNHVSENHIDDLEKIFTTLYKYKMKLNPVKCALKITSSKFLGFMVSHQEIEANPKKIQAIR